MEKMHRHTTGRFVQVWRKEAQWAAVRYWAVVRAEVFQVSFCTFHFSSYLYWAFVPGERNSNSTPAQSAIVVCHAISKLRQPKKLLVKTPLFCWTLFNFSILNLKVYFGNYFYLTTTLCLDNLLLLQSFLLLDNLRNIN